MALGPGGRGLLARSAPVGSWYLDLRVWDRYRADWATWHPHPVTMPTNLVLALASSVRRLLETGMDAVVGRRADLAKRLREGLRGVGLEPVPRVAHDERPRASDQPLEMVANSPGSATPRTRSRAHGGAASTVRATRAS